MGLLIFVGIIIIVGRWKGRKPVLDGRDQAADQSLHIFTGGKAELDAGSTPAGLHQRENICGSHEGVLKFFISIWF